MKLAGRLLRLFRLIILSWGMQVGGIYPNIQFGSTDVTNFLYFL